MEVLKIEITNPLLYDKLHTLACEYAESVDLLVNLAVKRLIDDVELVRNLRVGKISVE
jgi:hypothetical protein